MKQKTPTPKQCDVLGEDKNLLVIGRPGSGKTTVALWKAQLFIEQNALEDFQRVLFLSFSNAAVERILDAAKGRGGLPRRFRRFLKICTFHTFCFEILRPHAHLVGVAHPFKTLAPHQRQLFERKLPKAMPAEEKGIQTDQYFQQLEKGEGRASFDRFAPLVCEILKQHPDLRKAYSQRHPLILVDEYQDTDDHQDELMRTISCDSQLICLGDDNQQIYDWRSDISPTRLPDLEEKYGHLKIKLEIINHRSGGSGVLEYARAVLAGDSLQPPDSVEIRTYPPQKGRNKRLWVPAVRQAVGGFYEFAKAQEWANWREPSLAVMMRTNADIYLLSRLLREPSTTGSTIPHSVIMNYDLVPQVWGVVFALLECQVEGDRLQGFDCVLDRLFELETLLPNGGSQARRDQLQAWHKKLDEGRPIGGYGRLLEQGVQTLCVSWRGNPEKDLARILDLIKRLAPTHSSLTNLKTVLQTTDVADPRNEMRIVPLLADLFATSGSYSGSIRLGEKVAIERQLRGGISRMRHGTILLTLHKCKGKEFDGVILVEPPFNNRFVSDDARPHEREQARRLLHTAISRSRQRVYVITPSHEPCPLIPGAY